MANQSGNFWTDEAGATATEYSLITALVSIAIIVALGSLSLALLASFTETASQTAAAVSDG